MALAGLLGFAASGVEDSEKEEATAGVAARRMEGTGSGSVPV